MQIIQVNSKTITNKNISVVNVGKELISQYVSLVLDKKEQCGKAKLSNWVYFSDEINTDEDVIELLQIKTKSLLCFIDDDRYFVGGLILDKKDIDKNWTKNLTYNNFNKSKEFSFLIKPAYISNFITNMQTELHKQQDCFLALAKFLKTKKFNRVRVQTVHDSYKKDSVSKYTDVGFVNVGLVVKHCKFQRHNEEEINYVLLQTTPKQIIQNILKQMGYVQNI